MDVSDVPDEAVQAEVGVSSTTTESGGGAATGEAELRPPQSFPSMPYHTCNDGDWAIFLFGDGERRLSRVRKGAKTSVGKQQVLMDPMVGAPFDANFRSEPGCLVRDPRTVEQISGSVNDVIDAKSDASNAQLFDEGASSSAQQLGEGDIRRLKQKGMHGAELVKTIAANSVTFAGKTAFAQEKYLRKKAKKHLHYLTLVRPSPLTLCDFYMNKSPERLLSLRRDTLALMLAMSNVGPGERVLVLDGILGLAAAACLNALGGEGRVLCANLAKPQLDCVPYLNLPSEWTAILKSCFLNELLALPPLAEPPSLEEMRQREAAAAVETEAAAGSAEAAEAAEAATVEVAEGADGAAAASGEGAGAAATSAPGAPHRKPSNTLRGTALEVDAADGYSSLMVAVRESPAPAILNLLSRLRPGSPFVLYHHQLQPLAECLHVCQQAKGAVRLQLTESWTRKYQVAANRTHPEMSTYPPTGYLLSGVTVVPP